MGHEHADYGRFTELKISRQRKYQLRMERDGRCTICGADDRLASLAKTYSAQGYSVTAQLQKYPTPNLIEGITPDLVAVKGDKIIIIEVKSLSALRSRRRQTLQLAEYVRRVPNARFDLVVV